MFFAPAAVFRSLGRLRPLAVVPKNVRCAHMQDHGRHRAVVPARMPPRRLEMDGGAGLEHGAFVLGLDRDGSFQDVKQLFALVPYPLGAMPRRLVDDDAVENAAGEGRRNALVAERVLLDGEARPLAMQREGCIGAGGARNSVTCVPSTPEMAASDDSEGAFSPRSIWEMKPTESPAPSATCLSVSPSCWRRSRSRLPRGASALRRPVPSPNSWPSPEDAP